MLYLYSVFRGACESLITGTGQFLCPAAFLGWPAQPAAPISPCCLDAGTLELLQVNQQPAATPGLLMQDNLKALSSSAGLACSISF